MAAEPTTDRSGMQNGIRIGRVSGVVLRLNWSVGIIAALITWSLADSVLPELVEGRSTTAYWVTGATTSVLFFASLLAHELGHSMVAIRAGVGVEEITLWLFGGVARLQRRPDQPRDALRIAAAGPAVSAAIGVVAVTIGTALTGLPGAAALWLGAMNMMLMAFNLLPAFPLDGGRIYQAWLWGKSGDEAKATARAVEVGLGMGAVLVGLGVVQLFLGSLVGGIWMMAIGWFVREAARAEWRGAVVDDRLGDLTVADVMSPAPETVPASLTIDGFVAGLLRSGRHAAYPVVDASGSVTGLLRLTDIRATNAGGTTPVAEVALPIAQVATAAPTTPLRDFLADLDRSQRGRTLVFDAGRLVGIIAPSDLARLLVIAELDASRA